MGMFVREDPNYDESVRQKGFNRYKQLLSIRFGQWWKVNLITLAGLVPLAGGIFYSIGVSSMLVLLPCSVVGGMIAGPFLAGLYDAILRGLRDDPTPWRDAYARSWRQNWKGSLLPGALMVGGDAARPGYAGAVPVLSAAGAGGRHRVLAPAGAV